MRPLGWIGRVKSGGIGGMALLNGSRYIRAAGEVWMSLRGKSKCLHCNGGDDKKDVEALTLGSIKFTCPNTKSKQRRYNDMLDQRLSVEICRSGRLILSDLRTI